MATFENLRFCTSAEYKYFEDERLDIASLQVSELYVAVFSLKRITNTKHEAVALPLQVTDVSRDTFMCRGFSEKQRLNDAILQFQIIENNYITNDAIYVLPHEVYIDRGYIRDIHEGLDGTPPDIRASIGIEDHSELADRSRTELPVAA